ncbi:TonB-dependent receptor plug domain-containing protein [Mucilaginibacter sp. UR6-11]|uniref:TonB-dependent receptor n=1 Tax=Mucilaginibacter sp. UR6-11 TaxID=1435644 RepID=UPI001E3DED3A|nr:TonB-dependent receptor plug domain-containing protein [Mucilaginibacter sp. UR6-11]MCC8427286.1 TonB-dependent receptor [Mucilaginibacter sp. UR6-11]
MKYYLLLLAVFGYHISRAQNQYKVVIKDDKTRQVLPGATAAIVTLNIAAVADTAGNVVLSGIPNGKFEIKFTSVGYLQQSKIVMFPVSETDQPLEVFLEPHSGELAEVTIQTTRTNQNLRDIPTRVEALPQEELDEKGTMRPGDIKMLLGESTGINVQQTSAVSGTANFRIQGLDSRYTQLLQDGMPLYQGFSGGLSLMQVSPLNLKQVEFIKGSASTLYGGGAIAGLVNLISKTPQEDPEFTFLLNQNTAKGLDVSNYYAQKWQHVGTTIFTTYNHSGAYAPGNTTFTAVPKTNRFGINPKLFLYIDDKNKGWFGVNTGYESRRGGDIQVLNGNADATHQYFEQNTTYRFSTQFSFTHIIDPASQVNIKNTVGYFDRRYAEPAYSFNARQTSSYTEVNYVYNGKKVNWVAGVDAWTDYLAVQPYQQLGYTLNTFGGFAQNTYKANNWFSVESGLRLDYNTPSPADNTNGLLLLPRINALIKITNQLTSRVGGGLGYKMPTIFNDQTEQQGYQYLQPLIIGQIKAEKSIGLNGDINYHAILDGAVVNVNQLFFYTRVNNPLVLVNNNFINANGYLKTQGVETNVKVIMDELGIYLGYTHTDTRQYFNSMVNAQTLTPKNKISADVTYEIENSFRAGVEGFYTGSQLLYDGTTGRGYYTFGLLLQKMWKHFDVFINGENITNQRQTRWGSIYIGPVSSPLFKDIYAPLDGAVFNLGVKIKLM